MWKKWVGEAAGAKRRRGGDRRGTEHCTTLITALEQRQEREGGGRGSGKQSEVTRVSRVSSAAEHLLPKKQDGSKVSKWRRDADTLSWKKKKWQAQGDRWKRIWKRGGELVCMRRMHNACGRVSSGKSINTLTCVCVCVWETSCIPSAVSAEANWNSTNKPAHLKTSRSWVTTLSWLIFVSLSLLYTSVPKNWTACTW